MSLESLRQKIDEIDQRLVALINERSQVAVEIGEQKRGNQGPIYAPHREAEVIGRILEINQGPTPPKTIEAVYREIMSGSFALEQPLRIGFLGPRGTYSHVAAAKHFGSSVEFEDLHAIEGVFEEVARGHVNYGLVPIENSTGGSITETMDAFLHYYNDLNVYGELQLAVHCSLLANCEPHDVKTIYSKPEAINQCRHWLATQYPGANLVMTQSTAAAAEAAVRDNNNDPASGSAAIGSSLAGEIYGLHALFEQIEDRRSNITRFLIISLEETEISGNDKTSMMFTTVDKPGALVDVLNVFRNAEINLTHIDKRPSVGVNWEYTFFIDAIGHRKNLSFAEVIGEARAHCQMLTVLGSYPCSQQVL